MKHPQSVPPFNPSKPDEFWQDKPKATSETETAFIECMDLLRSALSISGRKGKNTNWEAFGLRLSQTLTKLHSLYNSIKTEQSKGP